MKKIYLILICTVLSISVFAQAPQSFSYQAVVRNSSGQIISDTKIGMRISILRGSASGTVVCVEEFTPETNNFGLVTLTVGSENVSDFAAIDWGAGSYFIKTELDIDGGVNYSEMGTSQLLSVPYALQAKVADSVPLTGNEPAFAGWDKDTTEIWAKKGNNIYYNNGYIGVGTNSPHKPVTVNGKTRDAYLVLQNNATGTETNDGFLTGASILGSAYVWNYESSNLSFGTDNKLRLLIKADGNIGVGTSIPKAKLDVSGDTKLGAQGVVFSELREVKGITHSANSYAALRLPVGYNEDNTRVLSVEINSNGTSWAGLGYDANTNDEISYILNGTFLYVYYPNVQTLKNRSFRALIMKID